MASVEDGRSTWVTRLCPVCDASAAAPVWVKGRVRVVQCRCCGMRYLNPVQLGWLTGQAYLQRAAYYVSADKLESDLAPQRFEREVRLFRRYCPTGSVLDVGCSTGGFLHQLHARFRGSYELTGVDVVGPALAEAQRLGLATVQGSFLDLDIGSARFDAVTFWAVLEHVAEPRRFLARAAAVLKPDGYCFILVPNARSLAFRLLGSRYRYIMAEHLNYFTAATLRRLIAAEPAFRLIRLTGTHFNPVILWQDLWHPRLEVPDAERARLLRRTTALKQNPALAPLRGLYSAVERCLGWVGLTDNLVAVLQRRSA